MHEQITISGVDLGDEACGELKMSRSYREATSNIRARRAAFRALSHRTVAEPKTPWVTKVGIGG
jgi:hypothetical protein